MSKIINNIKLNRLYSEPCIFDEIIFESGLNLIVGERGTGDDKQSRKTNSVGKSMCVDFIRFALLKKYEDTRISLIPENKINKEARVCLDFNIGEKNIIIKRKMNKDSNIILIVDNIESEQSETNTKKYDYAQVKSLRDDGLKAKEISEKLNIPLRTVYYILNNK